jgi:hypothetical protein
VAETGSIVLVTNEGNGRLVTSLPKVHVVLLGHGAAGRRLEAGRPAAVAAGPIGHRPAPVVLHQRGDRPPGHRRGRRPRRAAHRGARQRAQPHAGRRRATRCWPASAAGPASTPAPSTGRPAATPTAGSTPGPWARCSPPSWPASTPRRPSWPRLHPVRGVHGRLPGPDPAAGPAAVAAPPQGRARGPHRAGGVEGVVGRVVGPAPLPGVHQGRHLDPLGREPGRPASRWDGTGPRAAPSPAPRTSASGTAGRRACDAPGRDRRPRRVPGRGPDAAGGRHLHQPGARPAAADRRRAIRSRSPATATSTPTTC